MELTLPAFTKTFRGPSGTETFSLRVPSLHFKLGTIAYVMGHNGSGKSVFVQTLAGEVSSDQGRADVFMAAPGSTAGIGRPAVVPQHADSILALELTVRENIIIREVGLSLRQRFTPHRFSDRYLNQMLAEHSSLLERADSICGDLSVGQRQRLAFVCATSRREPVLLLDEFLSATDQATSSSLRALMREYVTKNEAVAFVVSHNPQTALDDADRILVFNCGRLSHDLVRGEAGWSTDKLRSII